MREARADFGARLKTARERAGIGLDAIAKSTKIKRSLLVDLENNDLTHWPNGIFRRAFFRGYLSAIGCSSDALVAEFSRLFPDSGATPTEDSAELRLTLAPMPSSTVHRLLTQTATAAADLGAVTLIAVTAVSLLSIQPSAVVAMLVVLYYGVSAALLGRAPVAAWLARDRSARQPVRTATLKPAPVEPALLRIVVRHADVPRDRAAAASGADEPMSVPKPLPATRRHATSR